MAEYDPKADLHAYLNEERKSVLWKLDGASEYDIRRPVVPSGTNLLGLVKHLTGVELGYFGETFERIPDIKKPWGDEPEVVNIDMWATADESREYIVGQYTKACEFADKTIEELPIGAIGHVPWWPKERNEVTLHRVLVHVATETARHAGHADIVRELIDGVVGLRQQNDNVPPEEAAWWADYYAKLEEAALEAARRAG
ncbi:MAG: DinB family protein [Acidimicrobiales bacterium]|jgi:hypothetical protein